ncbi:MFS transporter [Primorskyibacter aestuariivivens]|uniref:MFS transporter n=1 Tax=Primorskyibacter aestuariivivens TaxID=1888912 RepID=UPI0038CD13EB
MWKTRETGRDAAISEQVFNKITDGGADAQEARNGLRHVLALTASKLADGLVDPKLILSWLATSLGAPGMLVGLLVPIREAGALLPQVLLSGWLSRQRYRKWVWSAGAVGQGISAAAMVVIALTLSGWAAGVGLCLALAGLALSRSACSVSYKDILGKTVGTSRRGSVTGTAGSVASVGVVVLALLLMSGVLRQQGAVIAAIGLAALLWILAALVLSRLEETASEPSEQAVLDISPLGEDAQLRRFIAVRALLVPTSLAPPYFILLASDAGRVGLDRLGALVLVSAIASFLSSYVWGRLADRSSRKVLILSGALGALAMLGAVGAAWQGAADRLWTLPLALFVLMLAYHGVRQGRSTYLVDMSPEDQRAGYAALANTSIGVILLVVGALGGAMALLGTKATLILFAGLCVAAGLVTLGLDEVER